MRALDAKAKTNWGYELQLLNVANWFHVIMDLLAKKSTGTVVNIQNRISSWEESWGLYPLILQ